MLILCSFSKANGELYSVNQDLTTDLISCDEVKAFLQHLIVCFGATNYLEKCIAQQRTTKNTNQTNVKKKKHRKNKSNIKPIFNIQDDLSQDTYTPKDIKVKEIKEKPKTATKVSTRTNKVQLVRVYKVAKWQYHGYYLKNGTYVPLGYKHRHIHKNSK